MKEVKTKYRIAKQPHEDQAFWQQHIAAHAVSGVSKITYCYLNQVDYARFIYWSNKESLDASAKPLVAIKLHSIAEEVSKVPLCTLAFKSGACLHIHDERVLAVILDRLN